MRFLAILAAVIVLAGCTPVSELFSKDDTNYSCPKVGFLHGTDRLPLPEADVTMRGFSAACDFKEKRNVVVELTLPFTAKKKTKDAKVKDIKVSYFIALVSDDKVLQRQVFSTDVEFGEAEIASSSEEHTVRIPVRMPGDAYQYKVALGFMLTPEQLQQNKGKQQ